MSVGSRILRMRKERKLSREALSAGIDFIISPHQIRTIEVDIRKYFTPKELVALADFFDVSIDYLLDDSFETENAKQHN